MRRLALSGLVFWLALSTPVMAQEQSASAKLPRALVLAELLISTADRVAGRTTPDSEPAFRSPAAELAGRTIPTKGQMKERAARVYAERFTAQEIEDLIAFFSSPLAMKLHHAQAEVSKATSALLQQVLHGNTPPAP